LDIFIKDQYFAIFLIKPFFMLIKNLEILLTSGTYVNIITQPISATS